MSQSSSIFSASIRGLKKNDETRNRRGGGASRRVPTRMHSAKLGPYARSSSKNTEDEDMWTHDAFEEEDDREDITDRRRQTEDIDDGTSPALKIENLHYEVSEAELESLFSQLGTIIDGPNISYDKSGRSEGVAFVRFKEKRIAKIAKEKFDGAPAKGQKITITYDFRKPRAEVAAALAGPLFGRLGMSKTDLRDRDRNRNGDRGRGRGRGSFRSRGGRGGSNSNSNNRTTTSNKSRREERPKLSATDLDQELEAFMNSPNDDTKDVEMAS